MIFENEDFLESDIYDYKGWSMVFHDMTAYQSQHCCWTGLDQGY